MKRKMQNCSYPEHDRSLENMPELEVRFPAGNCCMGVTPSPVSRLAAYRHEYSSPADAGRLHLSPLNASSIHTLNIVHLTLR